MRWTGQVSLISETKSAQTVLVEKTLWINCLGNKKVVGSKETGFDIINYIALS